MRPLALFFGLLCVFASRTEAQVPLLAMDSVIVRVSWSGGFQDRSGEETLYLSGKLIHLNQDSLQIVEQLSAEEMKEVERLLSSVYRLPEKGEVSTETCCDRIVYKVEVFWDNRTLRRTYLSGTDKTEYNIVALVYKLTHRPRKRS